MKSYGFGFRVGFTFGHRLDQIMDLFFCLDLDLRLDSFFFLKSESESVNLNPTTSSPDPKFSSLLFIFYSPEL